MAKFEQKKYKLGDIFGEFHAGKTIKSIDIYNEGVYPVFGGNGIRGYTDTYNVEGEYVIIGRQGAYCGNVHYYVGKAYLTEHAIVGKPTNDHNAIYLAYKLSLINLSQFQGQSAQPGLSVETLSTIEIEAPDKNVEDYFASLILSLDKKISLNRAINQNIEALAKQLYDYWFVQFDFPNEEGKPYKSSGGKMVWNESLKRYIPEAWSNGTFSEIANITMGQSPDGSSYNENGNGSFFYQGSTDFGIRFPSVRMYTTSPSRFAKKGDILMSVRAPVGAVNIANTDCCIGRGLSAINSKIGSITYVYYVVHYLKVRFDRLNAAGTTFGAITKDDLFDLPVVIPNENVIKCFEAICKPIFDKQMKIGYEIEQLTALRDELLPLLMNGQVSIKNQ